MPAREKAVRSAKLSIIKIRRGCGSWQCGCKQPHSIPLSVQGKCCSVIIKLISAPKGTGLSIESECKKILSLAGIKDVWSETRGQTGSKINMIYALIDAIKKLVAMKVQQNYFKELGIVEGSIKNTVAGNE